MSDPPGLETVRKIMSLGESTVIVSWMYRVFFFLPCFGTDCWRCRDNPVPKSHGATSCQNCFHQGVSCFSQYRLTALKSNILFHFFQATTARCSAIMLFLLPTVHSCSRAYIHQRAQPSGANQVIVGESRISEMQHAPFAESSSSLPPSIHRVLHRPARALASIRSWLPW